MLNNLSSVNTYYTFIFSYTLHIVFISTLSYGDFAVKIKLLLTCVRDKVIAKLKIDIFWLRETEGVVLLSLQPCVTKQMHDSS